MSDREKKNPVVLNEMAQRFEVREGDSLAVLDYRLRSGNQMELVHTGVPHEMEGKGVASELARTALEHARANKLKILPLCSYVQAYLQRHPEFSDLLKTSS